MPKKLDKIRNEITEAAAQVENETTLSAILTLLQGYAAGASTDDEDEGDKKGKGKNKKGKKDEAEDDSSDKIDLSGYRKKQLQAIATSAKLDNVPDEKDEIIEQLENLKPEKLAKAIEKSGVND